jgi:hypothetical protein
MNKFFITRFPFITAGFRAEKNLIIFRGQKRWIFLAYWEVCAAMDNKVFVSHLASVCHSVGAKLNALVSRFLRNSVHDWKPTFALNSAECDVETSGAPTAL